MLFFDKHVYFKFINDKKLKKKIGEYSSQQTILRKAFNRFILRYEFLIHSFTHTNYVYSIILEHTLLIR